MFVDNKRLVFQQAARYLGVGGVRLDRMLNFKQQLEEVAGKDTYRVSLIRLRFACTTWRASAKTLRISTQALVFHTAEYCAHVWSRTPHVKMVDVAINTSLRTISGCLKLTPVFQLPVLARIAGLRRKAATLALARKAVKHDWHILHDMTKNEVPPCRLKSRKPYNKEAQEMLSVIPEDRMHGLREHGSRSGKHPGPPEYIATCRTQRRRQGRRAESKTLDDSKQTANWGRSVQSIHEEVGTGGLCRL